MADGDAKLKNFEERVDNKIHDYILAMNQSFDKLAKSMSGKIDYDILDDELSEIRKALA